MAAPYTAILRQLDVERFAALLAPHNRQNKERYFARHGVRAPKAAGTAILRPGHKNEVRAGMLLEALQKRDDEPLAEELLRGYLVQRRPMLAAALDYLKVPHEDGLTDSPQLSRFAELSAKEREALCGHLCAAEAASRPDAELYLDFMAISARPQA